MAPEVLLDELARHLFRDRTIDSVSQSPEIGELLGRCVVELDRSMEM